MNRSALGAGGLCLLILSCGAPPRYEELSRQDVRVGGSECTAVLYNVRTTEIIGSGIGLGKESYIQYKIDCGSSSTACRMDQPLDSCLKDIENRAQESSDSDSGGGGASPRY